MVTETVVARYARKNANPFTPYFPNGSFGRIVGEADSSMSDGELEKFARASTPEGFEFRELLRGDRAEEYLKTSQ